jgi:hypothetical protein
VESPVAHSLRASNKNLARNNRENNINFFLKRLDKCIKVQYNKDIKNKR